MWVNPEIPDIPGNTQKKKRYPEIPDRIFDTPTRPEPDPLPGILSNTRPDNEKPYPLGTADNT